jgi:hypothetical protein
MLLLLQFDYLQTAGEFFQRDRPPMEIKKGDFRLLSSTSLNNALLKLFYTTRQNSQNLIDII